MTEFSGEIGRGGNQRVSLHHFWNKVTAKMGVGAKGGLFRRNACEATESCPGSRKRPHARMDHEITWTLLKRRDATH